MAKATSKKTSKIPKNIGNDLNDDIIIQGAKMNNLKNVTVAIPRNKLVVVTGVSGSGKSSLTMDTLFAEGQRRYAESLSSYARQFLMRLDKPDVDFIKGICPAIAIEQKVTTRSPRSTVGSMTELLDYFRLLFARVGHTFSPISGIEVKKDDVTDVVKYIETLSAKSKVQIIIPYAPLKGRTDQEELSLLMQKGFSRIYLKANESDAASSHNLRIEELLETPDSLSTTVHQVGYTPYIVIDRIVVKKFEEDDLHRIADSVNIAFFESNGACWVETDNGAVTYFNNKFEADGMQFEVPTPNLFSYNNPYGACPKCEGFGQILGINIDLVIPDRRMSVYEDAVVCWRGEKMSEWKKEFINAEVKNGFPIHKPIQELSKSEFKTLQKWIDEFFSMVENNLYKIHYRIMQARFRGRTPCPDCQGSRLRQDALYVKVADKDISEISILPIDELSIWVEQLTLNEYDTQVAVRILIEIKQRLKTLLDVGLNYLNLNRQANTLSGGESQRIQLTKFLGSNLTDSMYILDEPSIGLHPRDTNRLIDVLKNLRDLNNTVIVVEHDDMMMENADYIIDMGPLAAHLGGEVIATGDYQALINNPKSLTGQYLNGNLNVADQITINGKSRSLNKPVNFIQLLGCRQNNLKDIDVSFPLNALTVVTGVSGSGKTTLVKQTLYPALLKHLGQSTGELGAHRALAGDLKLITQVEMVDQNPIGKSTRSNPVTYLKAYDDIRNLFANQQAAKIQGFLPKSFSFNTEGGRCDTCKGDGEVVVEMQFLADVHLVCDSCKGKRFKDEILEVNFRDHNIFDILEMGVDEAIAFFEKEGEKTIAKKLQPLTDVGLGYVKLGQPSSTLSGGEAQRVKLASFLSKGAGKEKVMFIFDEPTTGLHFHDISKLLKSFYALINNGHTVIVIEHNMDVVKNADWLIDIGPEGGKGGGALLYAGIPEGLKKIKTSQTAKFL